MPAPPTKAGSPAPLPKFLFLSSAESCVSSQAKMSPSAQELALVQWICASKLTSNDVSGSGDVIHTPECDV